MADPSAAFKREIADNASLLQVFPLDACGGPARTRTARLARSQPGGLRCLMCRPDQAENRPGNQELSP
ncbi:MAG: hypothetical protein G9473_13075 [Erythrobacter sp.]|nr:MAG: hypothetical protein G9473_13075 [Erythrobacter sp.]